MQAQATMPRDSPETALRTDEHRQKTLQAGEPGGSGGKIQEKLRAQDYYNHEYLENVCFLAWSATSMETGRWRD
jgi:hypothetical protein